MKLFILTKKKILTLAALTVAGILVLGVTIHSMNAFANPRKLPIYCVDRGDEKVVNVSFDAAWGNEQTQDLLNILAEHDVKSTFFLVGFWAEKYPESVKAIFEAGHDVGNHSDTHPHMPKLTPEKIKQEIEECNTKIERVTGARPTLFRPPYGDYDNKLVEAIEEAKMYCIQWDVDSLDWKDPTADQMVDRIRKKVKPGSLILMHNGAKNTPEALPKIIKALKEDGYRFVPISEIIHKQNFSINSQGKQIPENNKPT